MSDRNRTFVGLAAIALLAFVLVAAPSGGKAVTLIGDSLQAAFLAVIGISLGRLYRSQSEWLSALSDRDRGIFFGAGALALLTLAADGRFSEFSGGRVIEYGIIGACGAAMFLVWRESRRYSF